MRQRVIKQHLQHGSGVSFVPSEEGMLSMNYEQQDIHWTGLVEEEKEEF